MSISSSVIETGDMPENDSELRAPDVLPSSMSNTTTQHQTVEYDAQEQFLGAPDGPGKTVSLRTRST